MRLITVPRGSFVCILVVFLVVGLAHAAAPSGGYTPSQTTDPDCTIGETDCFVRSSWQFDTANNYIYNITESVGIGTATPTDLLHIVGALRLTGAFKDSNNATGTAGQVLSSTGSATDWITVDISTNTNLATSSPITLTNDTVGLDTTANISITGDWDFGGGGIEVENSTTVPGSCTVGQLFLDTDATSGQQLYACEGGSFVLQGDGSGGTPAGSDTQVQFNNGGAFGADPGLTYAASSNELHVAGAVATTTVYYDDAASRAGLKTSVGNLEIDAPGVIVFQNSSSDVFYLSSATGFYTTSGSGPRIKNEAPSATTPSIVPRQSDANTGIGSNASDQLSLIAGGIEGLRVTEVGNVITTTLTNALLLTPQSAAPSSPTLGTIYVDSDSNELCFYDGSSWTGLKAAGTCS